AFFTLLYESGSRVNALREVKCGAVFELPDGQLRMMLHAKGRPQQREVQLSAHAAAELRLYRDSFNRQASQAGRSERIEFGAAGPLWRSSWAGQWSSAGVARTFREACLTSGAHAFRLHSFRRAFATHAAASLPRYVVAQAG